MLTVLVSDRHLEQLRAPVLEDKRWLAVCWNGAGGARHAYVGAAWKMALPDSYPSRDACT